MKMGGCMKQFVEKDMFQPLNFNTTIPKKHIS